jgi:hypothetical protein
MIAMPRWAAPAVLAGVVVLWVFANRGASRSYFQDDDLDTLGWTWTAPASHYAKAMFSLEHSPSSLRPTGHAFYKVMEAVAGLQFPAWAAAVQALHLVNVALVWTMLRKFGLSPWPALAGVVLFLFHPATFDAYWRPMFVFDVLCATFSLACVLLYAHRRWVLSFVAFWVAYRAKELAVVLPVVLLVYEYTFGDRKPLRLIPFALTSASFAVQAVLKNSSATPEYTLHFTCAALAKTSRFYFYQMFRNFAAGMVLIASAALAPRDRRFAFGVAATVLFLCPLLFLPNRTLQVYVYVPLAFVALQVGLLADRWRWSRVIMPAAVLLLWVPATWGRLVRYQERELARADMNRVWVTTLADFVRSSPDTRAFVVEGRPSSLAAWGAAGAITYLTRTGEFKLASADSQLGRELLAGSDVALFIWDEQNRSVHVAHRKK